MPQAPPRRPPGKKDILQAVYEANRATAAPGPPRRARRPARPSPDRGGVGRAVGIGVLLVALVVAGTWSVARASLEPPPAPAPPAAAALEDPAPVRPPRAGGSDVADVLNLQVRTIMLDPNHGKHDPGAIGPGRLQEKDVTLDVARRLRDRLLRHGAYQVLLTRNGDRALALDERVAFANEAGADLYVSVHVNALPDPTLAPVETFYFGVEADSAARALALAGNEGSTFSVAEFNAAIRRAGTAVKLQESRLLAQSVQRALLERRELSRRPRADWGARPAPFAVLLHTEAPAILAEITALSNPAEEARLRTAAYRDAIADALEAGVLAYLRRSSPPAADPADAREKD